MSGFCTAWAWKDITDSPLTLLLSHAVLLLMIGLAALLNILLRLVV
jgi:hypothetical protein